LRLHTSIAISAYALLWLRIVWRFVKGHPGPMPKQAGLFYEIGKYCHYAILVAICLMLISGPMMVWSRGAEIHVWNWFTIPGPFGMSMSLFDAMHTIHVWCSRVIIIGTVLHLGGVYKHAAFNQDGNVRQNAGRGSHRDLRCRKGRSALSATSVAPEQAG